MNNCCERNDSEPEAETCCETSSRNLDWLLWGSLLTVLAAYIGHLFFYNELRGAPFVEPFVHGSFQLMNKIWWGLIAGIIAVSVIARIPRGLIIAALGKSGGLRGILRATAAGLAFDLCNHGILMVGVQLYRRGASLGQTMAFLIASPWNSLSTTIVLIALIGFKWTIVIVILSGLIAIVSGLIFERLVSTKWLPANPNSRSLPEGFLFWRESKASWKAFKFSFKGFNDMLRNGFSESRMILRWIFFGVVLASSIRALIPSDEAFASWFGPTISGLLLTILAATIIEVCSEGSSPIAADLVNRGGAPGNAFAFLMSGAATDYTEIMVLRETTSSWKIALSLSLVTVPQVVVIGLLLNLLR